VGQQPAHHAIWIREKRMGSHLRLPVQLGPASSGSCPASGFSGNTSAVWLIQTGTITPQVAGRLSAPTTPARKSRPRRPEIIGSKLVRARPQLMTTSRYTSKSLHSQRHYVGDRRSPSPFGPHNA